MADQKKAATPLTISGKALSCHSGQHDHFDKYQVKALTDNHWAVNTVAALAARQSGIDGDVLNTIKGYACSYRSDLADVAFLMTQHGAFGDVVALCVKQGRNRAKRLFLMPLSRAVAMTGHADIVAGWLYDIDALPPHAVKVAGVPGIVVNAAGTVSRGAKFTPPKARTVPQIAALLADKTPKTPKTAVKTPKTPKTADKAD